MDLLQHSDSNKDKSKNKNDSKYDNLNLRGELNCLIYENERLKDKINELIHQNEILKKELIEANKIISELYKNQNNQQSSDNLIHNLKEMIKIKDKYIEDLKLKLKDKENKTSVNYEDIMVVNFISSDQRINCGIKCLKTDTFAEVEEQLYQQYGEYRETNNNFLGKGKLVLRFKKIYENGIKDGDKIQLIRPE